MSDQGLLSIVAIIVIVILIQNHHAVRFVIGLILRPPSPHRVFMQTLKHGLAKTMQTYVVNEGGYAMFRIPLEKEPHILTSQHIPINEHRDVFLKKGSVPRMIMDIALVTPKGTSVFLQNYDERGPENRSKAEYMAALTSTNIERYRKTIRALLRERVVATLLERIMAITWVLHFGRRPKSEEVEYMMLYFRVFSPQYMIMERQEYMKRKPEFTELLIRNIEEASPESITGIWRDRNYFSREQMAVEVSHNILAMTMQWLTMSRRALRVPEEARHDTENFFQRNAFASFIASSTRSNHMVVQVLGTKGNPVNNRPSEEKKKCPFHTGLYVAQGDEIVPVGHKVNTDPAFNAFGHGYRRCAGEVLTRVFLQELLEAMPVEPPSSYPKAGTIWGLSVVQ